MTCALSFYMMCFRSIVQLHTHRNDRCQKFHGICDATFVIESFAEKISIDTRIIKKLHDFISQILRTEISDDATDIIDVITRSVRIENHSYQKAMSEYKFVETVTTPLNECLIFRKYWVT